jgi:SpoVK/Ycf46/Vps4 family AAA+-type ATPase
MSAQNPPAIQRTELGESADMAKRLELFVVETPRRKLADLVVPEATRRQIQSVLTKVRCHKLLYEDFGLADVDPSGQRTAINFYGPPGTGKSFAAEALAAELGMGLIRANYAEIESKFVGETPKNIRAAFLKAQRSGALLFFDEADSILGKRLSNVSQSTDHAVNLSRSVMLMQLDQFSGVVVFATNLASNYDPAFVRRILAHVAMPMPDAEARARLWRRHIPARLPVKFSEADWNQLVAASAGLAGGDILNAVVTAASSAVERDSKNVIVGASDFLAAVKERKRAKREVGAK